MDFSEISKKVSLNTNGISIPWKLQRRIEQILSKFNIIDLKQKVGDLSGGQKKKD